MYGFSATMYVAQMYERNSYSSFFWLEIRRRIGLANCSTRVSLLRMLPVLALSLFYLFSFSFSSETSASISSDDWRHFNYSDSLETKSEQKPERKWTKSNKSSSSVVDRKTVRFRWDSSDNKSSDESINISSSGSHESTSSSSSSEEVSSQDEPVNISKGKYDPRLEAIFSAATDILLKLSRTTEHEITSRRLAHLSELVKFEEFQKHFYFSHALQIAFQTQDYHLASLLLKCQKLIPSSTEAVGLITNALRMSRPDLASLVASKAKVAVEDALDGFAKLNGDSEIMKSYLEYVLKMLPNLDLFQKALLYDRAIDCHQSNKIKLELSKAFQRNIFGKPKETLTKLISECRESSLLKVTELIEDCLLEPDEKDWTALFLYNLSREKFDKMLEVLENIECFIYTGKIEEFLSESPPSSFEGQLKLCHGLVTRLLKDYSKSSSPEERLHLLDMVHALLYVPQIKCTYDDAASLMIALDNGNKDLFCLLSECPEVTPSQEQYMDIIIKAIQTSQPEALKLTIPRSKVPASLFIRKVKHLLHPSNPKDAITLLTHMKSVILEFNSEHVLTVCDETIKHLHALIQTITGPLLNGPTELTDPLAIKLSSTLQLDQLDGADKLGKLYKLKSSYEDLVGETGRILKNFYIGEYSGYLNRSRDYCVKNGLRHALKCLEFL